MNKPNITDYDELVDLITGSGQSMYGYEESSDKEKKHCYHKWVKYVGFTETYMFCELCGEKREVRENEK